MSVVLDSSRSGLFRCFMRLEQVIHDGEVVGNAVWAGAPLLDVVLYFGLAAAGKKE